ncbi:hypothetical protein [Rhabdochromatium marinum]|uniref:hypothetical protein n=1 Tax=Rhabdochromatium marinum TaxID=48729 RepID=UPI001907FCC1|nr:hypothetical protein [Rhabdochromatium marinum]
MLTLGITDTGFAQDEALLVKDASMIRAPQRNIEDFWNSFEWSELTTAEQAAWAKLEWDQTNWDGQAPPPASETKQWNELTPDEQAAATQLGYNEISWNIAASNEQNL